MVPSLASRALCEFVGTFTLIAVGLGAVFSVGVAQDAGALLTVAFAHGLAIAVMVTAVGHVSGGHFNPAVTFAMLFMKQIRGLDAGVYWVAQIAGGVAGAIAIRAVFPAELRVDELKGGAPALADNVSVLQGFGLEALMTFILVWVIFAVAVDREGAYAKLAGLPIGLTITADILMGGKLTGAAMNPARQFGPALVENVWGDWWVYWFGPFIGAAIAAVVFIYGVRPRLQEA